MTKNLTQSLKLKRDNWCEAVEKEIILLNDKVQTKDSEIKRLNDIINSLKKDFKYNVGLIKQRDTELAKYESQIVSIKNQLNNKEHLCSSLSVKLEEYISELSTMNSIKVQLQEELKQSFGIRHAEKEEMLREFKLERDKARSESNAAESNFKMELARMESNFVEQKEELFSDIHKTLKEKDNEYSQKTFELKKLLSNSELKCQLLEKELSAINEKRSSDESTISNLESVISSLKQESDLAHSEMKSDIAVLEFEKNRLNNIINLQKQAHQKLLCEHTEQQKCFDLKLKEKTSMIDKLKETQQNECEVYSSKIEELTTSLQIIQNELNEKKNAFNELEKSFLDENATIKSENNQLSSRVSKLNSDLLEKDYNFKEQISRLQEQNDKLLDELKNRETSMERLHEELSVALTINDERVQEQYQQEFELHQKSEHMEATRLNHFENMVQRIIQSRNDIQARNMKLVEMLHEKEKSILSLSQNSQHSQVSKEVEHQFKSHNQKLLSRINDLESQNESLRGAIREMSKEVFQAAEKISDTPKGKQNYLDITELTTNFNKVQKERLELLALCRNQQIKISSLEKKISHYELLLKDSETNIDYIPQEASPIDEENQSLHKRYDDGMNLNQSNLHQEEIFENNIPQASNQLQSHKSSPKMQATDSNRKASPHYCPTCNPNAIKSQLNGSQIFKEVCEKLKQASTQIQKLATEKQVLIDLSNRFRAELRDASKNKMTDFHIARHPLPSKQHPQSHITNKNEPKQQGDTHPERLESTTKNLNNAMIDMQKKIEHLEKLHDTLIKKNENSQRVASEPKYCKQPINETDSVNTSQAIDRLDDIFHLLDEPASLNTSCSFNARIDHNPKEFDIDSDRDIGFHSAPPLQVRGRAATFGLRD